MRKTIVPGLIKVKSEALFIKRNGCYYGKRKDGYIQLTNFTFLYIGHVDSALPHRPARYIVFEIRNTNGDWATLVAMTKDILNTSQLQITVFLHGCYMFTADCKKSEIAAIVKSELYDEAYADQDYRPLSDQMPGRVQQY